MIDEKRNPERHLTIGKTRRGRVSLSTVMREKMIRILVVILIAAVLTGCTRLSETEYLTVEGTQLERHRSACGYYDVERALFGRGNFAKYIGSGDASVEFCSTSYYSKDIATGPIIPLIPLVQEPYRKRRWVQIKNAGKGKPLAFLGVFNKDGKSTKLDISKSRYPETGKDFEEFASNSPELQIKPNEHLWVAVPAEKQLKLRLKLGSELLNFDIVESKGYSLWLVTV